MSSRRCGSRRGSPAGSTAHAPGSRPARSSAFAAAIASSEPSSSRCAGPTLTITPTSGSAIAVSWAIWPGPRIAISRTIASLSAAAPRSARGRPISVLRFSGVADTLSCPASSEARMSFVEVFPVEPVTAITDAPRAPSSRRHSRASAWSAARGSGCTRTAPSGAAAAAAPACSPATSTPHAPACRAWPAWLPPSVCSPRSPKNRSPGPAPRESIVALSGPSGEAGLRCTPAPAAPAIRSRSQPLTRPRPPRAGPAGPRAPRARRRHRRTGSCARR